MIIGAEVAQTIADHADSEDGVALGAGRRQGDGCGFARPALRQLDAARRFEHLPGIQGQRADCDRRAGWDGGEHGQPIDAGFHPRGGEIYGPVCARHEEPERHSGTAQCANHSELADSAADAAQGADPHGRGHAANGANSWEKDKQNAALHFLNSFIAPWTAGSETQDEKLDELVELAYSTGETSFLPGKLVDGNKYSVTINKTLAKALKIGRVGVGQYESVTLHLTDEEKRWANSAYADALWNGSGRDVTGLRKLMDSRKWQRMNDEAKMTAVKEEAAKAKKAVLEEMVRRR